MVSLQGLAVAKGGNHCVGAAGGLTVSVARAEEEEEKAGGPGRATGRRYSSSACSLPAPGGPPAEPRAFPAAPGPRALAVTDQTSASSALALLLSFYTLQTTVRPIAGDTTSRGSEVYSGQLLAVVCAFMRLQNPK